MRILAFSDLHRDLAGGKRLVEQSREADVVVCAGDLASMHEGLEETIGVLSAIEVPTVLVPGNNETDEALRAACEGWQAAKVLHGDAEEIDEVPFFGLGGGIPVTPWDWSFDLSEEEATAKLAACPGDAVLVVHSPPQGHADETGGRHLGSEAIRDAIAAHSPRLAVCGHIHEAWGVESEIDGSPVVNLGPGGRMFDV